MKVYDEYNGTNSNAQSRAIDYVQRQVRKKNHILFISCLSLLCVVCFVLFFMCICKKLTLLLILYL